MFRPGTTPTIIENINFTLSNAGMGDCITALVPINYVYKHFPWVNPIIWVPDYMVEFAKHVLPPKSIVKPYSKGKKEYNNELSARMNEWKLHTAMRTHPVDHCYHMMLDISPDIEHKNYLSIRPEEIDISRFSLPEKYVVIPLGATTKSKTLPIATLNSIAKYAKEKGYTPVFLGKKSSATGYEDKTLTTKLVEADTTLGIDLTDKTSLLESGAIIAGSKAIIGMEGGLVHLAGFTDTNIIASYTFVDPKVLAPYRNNSRTYKFFPIVPPEDLGCRFCQTNIQFLFNDFKECLYSDYRCATDMTFQYFKRYMDIVLC